MDLFNPADKYYQNILSKRISSFKKINPFRKSEIFSIKTAAQFVIFITKMLNLLENAE